MKHTKTWSNAWTGKLKDDLTAAGGELAVLVSTAFPADVQEPMLQYDGVWLGAAHTGAAALGGLAGCSYRIASAKDRDGR